MTILLGSVFKYFSLPTTVFQSMSQLREKADIWHSDTVASPAELILHDHCIDAGCIGFSEDVGIGATVFPSDVRHF